MSQCVLGMFLAAVQSSEVYDGGSFWQHKDAVYFWDNWQSEAAPITDGIAPILWSNFY